MCSRGVCFETQPGFRSRRPRAGRREGEEGKGRDKRKKKNKRVQSSEADDCVFVRANLFITDAREISIEMILVTDSPWISPMADTQNVYVYRS